MRSSSEVSVSQGVHKKYLESYRSICRQSHNGQQWLEKHNNCSMSMRREKYWSCLSKPGHGKLGTFSTINVPEDKNKPTANKALVSSIISSPNFITLHWIPSRFGSENLVGSQPYSIITINSGFSTSSNGWSQAATHSMRSLSNLSWSQGSCHSDWH